MQAVTVARQRDTSPASCNGRAPLPFAEASRIARHQVRRGERGLVIFSCRHCRGFHVAHQERRAPRRIRRAR